MLSDEEKKVLEAAEKIKRREAAAGREESGMLESLRRHEKESLYGPSGTVSPEDPGHNSSGKRSAGPFSDLEENESGAEKDRPEESVKSPEKGRKRRKAEGRKKKHHVFRNILFVILGIFAALFITGFILGGKTDYKKTEDFEEDASWDLPGVCEKGVFNILLVGTDARAADEDSRSDCMILVSICPLQHKIYLNSILRDCYVTIPGIGQNRINHAYQMGGITLLKETIEQNFHIRVDRYARVDFFSFVDMIDALGGVTITVTEGEADYVNGYLAEINTLLGLEVSDGCIPGAGTYEFNGRQALSYARIRYIGTDFARTGRQRTVIQAMITKMKKDPVRAFTAAAGILSDLETDLTRVDFGILMMRLPFLLTYKVESNQIPFDGTWWNETGANVSDVLGIDFDAINEKLRLMIYGR